MSIKTNAKLITSAVLISAAGLAITGCSSTHHEHRTASYQTGRMSEASGASASSEWQRGAGQSSDYSATSESYSQSQGQSHDELSAQNEIRIPLHEETVSVGKRSVDAGQVTLRKVVTTETVNQPVQLRRETLVIDRTDNQSSAAGTASSGSESFAPFQEKTMTIRLQREEPVIQKQTVVTGNIVARRNAQTEQSNISEQVRKENVEVDKGEAANNVVLHGNFYEVREGAGAQRQSDQSQPQSQDQQQQQQQDNQK